MPTHTPISSSHAIDGNYPHIQIEHGHADRGYLEGDSVQLSEGGEITAPRGIWRKVKPLSVSCSDTLLLSRIRSYKYHDRG